MLYPSDTVIMHAVYSSKNCTLRSHKINGMEISETDTKPLWKMLLLSCNFDIL